jgi:tRNA uridine 5-carbamoylmethylation protein Kti12
MKDHFEIILLLGRPASGKSEVIDYLKKTPIPERLARFHIAGFEEIDDFPMLWTWFEEDAILEKIIRKSRVHSDADGYFLHPYQWDLLVERISLEYQKKLRDPGYAENKTTLIEFSRGTEHGGYASAFRHLSKEILEKACILYVDVPYEESLRKNRRRFNPSRPDSILEHGLPDAKLERLYKDVDWESFKGTDPKFIPISGLRIPYVVFDNMPEKTDKPDVLGAHLEDVLNRLWAARQEVRP